MSETEDKARKKNISQIEKDRNNKFNKLPK
jgi:hypothetical protein